MKSRLLLYLVNLVIPIAFLMVIDLISFYLPVHQIDPGAFKMTVLLGYTVFLLIMNDLLPNNAGKTPIIGIYFSVCLALMVVSLFGNRLICFAFLMVIDLISFYLPVHQIDPGAFKMTVLLGYTVFLLIMNDLLPNNAGKTPIIGNY
ncbi:UNVERIFIED_CONTAM: hypothetical protein FKN15_074727 [Acipenser sinensis]